LIVSSHGSAPAHACIESIVRQSVCPSQVVVITPEGTAGWRLPVAEPHHPLWRVLSRADGGSAAARNDALEMMADTSMPLAIAFVDDDWTLAPDYVAQVGGAFERCCSLGIVVPWLQEGSGVQCGLTPAFPYQWAWNDVGPCAAFRTAAVLEAGGLRPPLADSYATWDLSNAILAGGWQAAPFPTVLASRSGPSSRADPVGKSLASRQRILERCPELVAAGAAEIVVLLLARVHHLQRRQGGGPSDLPLPGDRTMTALEIIRATPRQQLAVLRRAAADPRYVARWLGWHGHRAIGKASQRLLTLFQMTGKGRRLAPRD
jgi:hypothetical protein